MEKLIVPKELCLRLEEEVYITKEKIEKERWLLLKNYNGYNIYYIYDPIKLPCIYPYLYFGCHYVMQHIDNLIGIKDDYEEMEKFIRGENILLPPKRVTKVY